MRDYIHVVDLARGHVAALDWMAGRVGAGEAHDAASIPGMQAPNGARSGVGVFNQNVKARHERARGHLPRSKACGKTIPYEIKPRRDGDMTTDFADATKAREELGWMAEYDMISTACARTSGAGSPPTPTATV